MHTFRRHLSGRTRSPCCVGFNMGSPMFITAVSGGSKMGWFKRKCSSPLLATAIIACVVLPAWAVWVDYGVPLCRDSYPQQNPCLASDGAGGAIAFWCDWGISDICAQRINAFGTIQWTTNGVPLGRAPGDPSHVAAISDGSGGAIVTWNAGTPPYDTYNDIYAQRIDSSGTTQWTTGGVPLCLAVEHQLFPGIVTDGAGGAIVTWWDLRTEGGMYAQRVDASGAVQWTADGVQLNAPGFKEDSPPTVPDGAGGAIVAWANGDVYAQRVDHSGTLQWGPDGVPLCSAAGNQIDPTIVSDGAGGALIVWTDYRNGYSDVYGQRVDASGTAQWTADGLPIRAASGSQSNAAIATDGFGGAIVGWLDSDYGGSHDIYVQRIDVLGATQWVAEGVPICAAAGDQLDLHLVQDGAGGAIVSWCDYRSSNPDIYTQHVDASGVVRWMTNGMALCTAAGNQLNPASVPDGGGGAILAWQDERSGQYHIYAQQVDDLDNWGFPPAVITSIQDVPGDQGGWLRVYFDKSRFDSDQEGSYLITGYYVFRRIDDVMVQTEITRKGTPVGSEDNPSIQIVEGTSEAPISSCCTQGTPGPGSFPFVRLDGRYYLVSEAQQLSDPPPGTWEVVASVPAHQDSSYICLVPTLADSTSDLVYSVYCISAETPTPWVYFFSEPDSGYSIDNLSPSPPAALAAEYIGGYQLYIHWNPNTEGDLSHYAVYRGTTPDFLPDEASRMGTAADSSFVDNDLCCDEYYYKVSAWDVHENESPFALLTPDMITGAPQGGRPCDNVLFQNSPNPFMSSTRIAFSLKEGGHVRLRVFDARGRLIRVLADENREANHYIESWDGRDRNGRMVAAGTYFYDLEARGWNSSKKMTLTR